jgi:hypothetical protein
MEWLPIADKMPVYPQDTEDYRTTFQTLISPLYSTVLI